MRLRVLTLNVWGLPLGIARHSAARMRAIGAQLRDLNADLVALQEVWTAEAREQLREAAEKAGYTQIWHRRRAFGGSGLMVLSRLPFQDIRFTPFRLEGLPQRPQHADYYGGKGFVELTVDTEAGPVVIVNTHLHAGYRPSDEPDEYAGVRAAQAIQLATDIRAISQPVIALGDFNSDEAQPARQILLGLSGLADVADELDHAQATSLRDHPYRDPKAEESRIDLILARRGKQAELHPLSIRRVLDAHFMIEGEKGSYSDHAGLLAEFDLRRVPNTERIPSPPNPEAVALARKQIELGLKISQQRQTREARYAAGGLALGAFLGAGAWSARRSRRQWLFRVAATLASVGAAGASGLFLASGAIGKDEAEGYAQMTRRLEALQPNQS